MARAGMANLIKRLRAETQAGTADYTLAGVTYFVDDQIEAALDRTQRLIQGVPLIPLPTYEDGVYRYYDYGIPLGRYFEESETGSGWAVKDSGGATVTDYTVNYASRRITFNTDQAGKTYTLDARAYNLNAAAAEIWEQKAAYAASKVDWNSDNHGVQANQEYLHCLAMARRYRQMAGPKISQLVRLDEAGR
jgi:hypothetical protein